MDDLKMARALGWATFGIAAAEAFAPEQVEQELGIDDHRTLLQALAAREAIAGATILSQKSITPTLAAGLWSRVAGDAMDLALLGMAAPRTRNPNGLAAVTAMVAGITALDVWVALRVQKRLTRRAAAMAEDPMLGAKKARLREQGVAATSV